MPCGGAIVWVRVSSRRPLLFPRISAAPLALPACLGSYLCWQWRVASRRVEWRGEANGLDRAV